MLGAMLYRKEEYSKGGEHDVVAPGGHWT